MRRITAFLLANLLLITADGLFAASNTTASFNIPEISQEPQLSDFDGMQPATALARQMSMITGLVQRLPDVGAPGSQRTEVYLGYDNTNLYAVFLAFDSNPDQIRSNLSSRENTDGDDRVEITIDTFNDQRAAYTFRSNPLGIQWDARWTEGASNRSGFDTSFEAVWYTDGQVTDQGYQVKMTIPLRGLRFPDSDQQRWRVQVGREIPRRSEEQFWPPYSIEVEGRLNQTAMLNGIQNVSPGNNFQLIPFVFTRDVDSVNSRALGGPRIENSLETDVGLDAKYVFNDSLVLDITVNPDFSQVESDQPQVTVNERFEVQFPERRPFFVENADFFATDSILVFTRRIVDPEAGMRFTGRAGNWGIGTMLMNDEAPGLNREAGDPLQGEKANIGIFRLYRDFSQQNRVGVLISDRELAEGYNRVASIDARIKLNDNWTTQPQFVETRTEPIDGGEHISGGQTNVRLDRVGRTYNTHIHYIETDENFRAQLGFQNRFFRSGTDGLHSRHGLTFYPEEGLNSWETTLFGVYLKDQNGVKVFSQFQPSFNLRWDTTSLSVGHTGFSEILRPQDFNGISSTTGYDYENWNIGFNSDYFSTASFGINYRSGTTLNLVPAPGSLPDVADLERIDIDFLWRPIDRLRVNNTYLLTKVDGRNGKVFSNEIIRSNWNYQFTKELSLRFIAQYEETDAGTSRLRDDENLNFDLLLRYVINPWSAFYVGYNTNSSNFDIIETEGERELILTDSLKKDGDQIFVKFSYLFQR